MSMESQYTVITVTQRDELENEMSKLTASKEWLKHEAAMIEQSTKESLRAWILLGQEAKYAEEMAKVAALRRAADEKSIALRREALRNLGY